MRNKVNYTKICYDVILEDGTHCRVWGFKRFNDHVIRPVIGEFATGLSINEKNQFVPIQGIIKEIVAINHVKQKDTNHETR